MRVILKISGLLLAGAGAFLMQNSPDSLRSNICSWEFAKPCPDWFDNAAVDQLVFACLLITVGAFFLSLAFPALAKNYQQTVTAVMHLNSSPTAPHLSDSGPVYWELTQALSWIAFGDSRTVSEWAAICRAEGLLVRPPEETAQFNKAEGQLFEALRAGKITAKGKKNQSEIYEDIPSDYFLSNVACQILHNVIDVNHESGTAKYHWDGPKWRDVRLEREAVLKLWPRDSARKLNTGKSCVVERDVWLLDAVFRLGLGSWHRPDWNDLTKDESKRIHDATDLLRQAAFDGKLPIWGRTGFSDVLRIIPSDYWEYYGINWWPILKLDAEGLNTELRKGNRPYGEGVFHHLRTSRKRVEELWPAGGI